MHQSVSRHVWGGADGPLAPKQAPAGAFLARSQPFSRLLRVSVHGGAGIRSQATPEISSPWQQKAPACRSGPGPTFAGQEIARAAFSAAMACSFSSTGRVSSMK